MSRSNVAGAWAPIKKAAGAAWNLPDYDQVRRGFSWATTFLAVSPLIV